MKQADFGGRSTGLDLDGFTSTPEQAQHCQSDEPNAKKDGVNGVDNAHFEALKVLPGAIAAQPNQHWSLALELSNLGADPSYASLPGRLRVVESTNPPKWDTTDEWRPRAAAQGPTIAFEETYLANHVWVGKTQTPGILRIAYFKDVYGPEAELTLAYHSLWVVAELDAAHGRIVKGAVGAVLPRAKLGDSYRGAFSALSLCGSAANTLLLQMQRTADSLLTGGQDASMVCDALSFGMSFSGPAVSPLGAVLPLPPKPPNPCP